MVQLCGVVPSLCAKASLGIPGWPWRQSSGFAVWCFAGYVTCFLEGSLLLNRHLVGRFPPTGELVFTSLHCVAWLDRTGMHLVKGWQTLCPAAYYDTMPRHHSAIEHP